MASETIESFSDLPLVLDNEDARRVHRTAGLYFAKRGGLAHAVIDCDHLDWMDLGQQPKVAGRD